MGGRRIGDLARVYFFEQKITKGTKGRHTIRRQAKTGPSFVLFVSFCSIPFVLSNFF
jgi:hypothetical protein